MWLKHRKDWASLFFPHMLALRMWGVLVLLITTLKPHISRFLEAKELISSTSIEVEVVYHQAEHGLLPTSGCGRMYNRTIAGGIEPILT